MDYVIECRPSPGLIEALQASGARELARFLNEIVYFARGFSCPDGPSAEEIALGVREDILDASRTLPEGVRFEVEGVKVSEGSVIILIFATAAIASHAGGGAAAAGGALHGSGVLAWAGGELAGGALQVLGSKITEKILGRIKSWFKRKGRVEPNINVIDPQVIAETEAKRLAAENKCSLTYGSGGMRVGEHCYQYIYDLGGCAKKLLTITVCAVPPGQPPTYIMV